MGSTAWKALIPVLVGIIIAVLPVPQGLEPKAWYFFACFTAVIVGLVLEPIPSAAIGFIGIALVAALGLVAPKPGDSIKWALSGFSNSTVWLIFGAFMLALGYEKTGLGKRIALVLVKALGRKTLGLGYAVTFSRPDPRSVHAIQHCAKWWNHIPGYTEYPYSLWFATRRDGERSGAYVLWTAFAATCVTSSMFVTALAPNLLALELVTKTSTIGFEWVEWLVRVPAGRYNPSPYSAVSHIQDLSAGNHIQ